MTKLKTLKDFERSECHGEQRCYCDIHSVANVEDLKSEAVKWVKNAEEMMKIGRYSEIMGNAVKNSFMTFFNLTKADLQEGK